MTMPAAPGRIPGVYVCQVLFGAGTAVGTTLPGTVTVTADVQFLCTRLIAVGRQVTSGRIIDTDDQDGATENGGQCDFPYDIVIKEQGSGYAWMDKPVDGAALFISGRPWNLATARLIPGGQSLEVNFTTKKLITEAHRAQIMFDGTRIYGLG